MLLYRVPQRNPNTSSLIPSTRHCWAALICCRAVESPRSRFCLLLISPSVRIRSLSLSPSLSALFSGHYRVRPFSRVKNGKTWHLLPRARRPYAILFTDRQRAGLDRAADAGGCGGWPGPGKDVAAGPAAGHLYYCCQQLL